jgi:RNA polymerase-binding transcription factor
MTAPLEMSHCTGNPTDPRVSTSQADTLRVLLIAGMGEQSAKFAHHAAALAALTANASQDPTGRDRAMAALHMFTAREAIEEIEDAFVRIDDGRYGTCQSCDQPIPLERLQMIPQARTCAACPRPGASSADGPAASRLGQGRGEHTGPPSARGVLAAVSTGFASHVGGVT